MICIQAYTIIIDTTAGINHTDNGSGIARVNYL